MKNNTISEREEMETQTEEQTVGAYHYTYRALSPKQKREAESILREYEPQSVQEKSDFEKLQILKRRIDDTSTVFGLVLGIVGCLIFGGGLSCILLRPESVMFLIVGGALCLVGVAVMVVTYPLYRVLEKRLRKKYKDEIIRLCKSVLNDQNDS